MAYYVTANSSVCLKKSKGPVVRNVTECLPVVLKQTTTPSCILSDASIYDTIKFTIEWLHVRHVYRLAFTQVRKTKIVMCLQRQIRRYAGTDVCLFVISPAAAQLCIEVCDVFTTNYIIKHGRQINVTAETRPCCLRSADTVGLGFIVSVIPYGKHCTVYNMRTVSTCKHET